jgi:hypothetical protein
VSHIRRQQGQLGLDVGAGAVPPKQGLDCKRVSKVMKPWHAPGLGADLGGVEKAPDHVAEARAGVGAPTPRVVPEEWAPRRNGDLSSVANRKIRVELAGAVA